MKTALFCLIGLITSFAHADDFKTVNGKEYKNANVSHVEADGIVIKFSGGIVKLGFSELPEEMRHRYSPQLQAPQSQPQQLNQTQAEAQAIDKWNAEVRRIQEGRERYKNLPRYTLHQFEMSQFYLVGQTIIVDFSFRGETAKRIDRETFEGYIWRNAEELLRESQEGKPVLFHKDGLAWYQALPTKSTSLTMSVFARVEDNGAGGTLLRLLGTRVVPDKDGILDIAW